MRLILMVEIALEQRYTIIWEHKILSVKKEEKKKLLKSKYNGTTSDSSIN